MDAYGMEPTPADLDAIEAEWPVIEAELGVLDTEIAAIAAPRGPRRWTGDGCGALAGGCSPRLRSGRPSSARPRSSTTRGMVPREPVPHLRGRCP